MGMASSGSSTASDAVGLVMAGWTIGVKELCSQPSTQRGVDYLSTSAMGQAAVLPSSRVGGQIYGSSCGGGGLDENIMLFMPEVAVLSLLLSESKTQPQLQAPAWVLGARMIMTGLDGTGHWMAGMVPDAKLRLTSDLTTIHLNGAPLLMSKSKPFVAVPPAFQVSFQDVDDLKEARQNRNLDQRAVKGQNSFAAQVMAWYQALSLDAVPPALRRSMPSLVSSIGTGPWMSGSRFGDSQLDVLSIWLGQALVAKTWTGHLLSDYYLYSYFTENPGNQCFLHSSSRCGDCLWTCSSKQFPPGSFYLQDKGFMSQDHSKPCVLQSEFACPSNGIETIFWNFGLKPASELWKTLEKVLIEHKDQNTRSVFDRLFDELSSSLHQKLDPYAGKAS
ncbi:Hypothetical protein SCF082_LOCUS53320 [Durusdinium trenchii]|uniref:Poly(ADP-ribose) glycohydrolase n=1 Tax=Durusdinium trenchii TaxID=1381693 RepID=A0ABP0SRW1_9DINO